jgi:hypothetical protein
VVEGARLEIVYAGDRIEGSNPSPSAILFKQGFIPCLNKICIVSGFEPSINNNLGWGRSKAKATHGAKRNAVIPLPPPFFQMSVPSVLSW